MKKTLALLLVLALAVTAFAACGKTGGGATADAAKQLTVQEQSKARYALGLMVNRADVVQLTAGGEVPATGFYPSTLTDGLNADVRNAEGYGSWYTGTNTVSSVNAEYTEDQAEACQILIDLGYAYTGTIEGGDIKFTNFPTIEFSFNNAGANALVIQYVQETWNKFGITGVINTEAWATLQQKLKEGDAEAARMGWVADFNDPINFLEIFISSSGNNYPRLGREIGTYTRNSETTKDAGMGAYWGADGKQTWAEAFDALVDQIKAEADPATRAELCAEAENILMATGAVAPMYYYVNPYMAKSTLSDFNVHPSGAVIWNYAKNSASDTVNVMLGGGTPLTMDPALNSASVGSNCIRLSFQGLLGYNEKGELGPELAESYTLSEDGKTYTFQLREGLKWSDGTDFFASDFIKSWSRAADTALGADYGFLFDTIERNADGTLNMVADDEARTLVVQLVNPTAYFPELCAFTTFYPVKVENADNEGAWAINPATYIGTGPFRMTKYAVDDVISYEKNENYWNADKVSLKNMNLYLSEDNTAILTAYENNTVQFIESIDTTEFTRLNTEYPGELVMGVQLGTWYLLFNVHKDLSPVA